MGFKQFIITVKDFIFNIIFNKIIFCYFLLYFIINYLTLIYERYNFDNYKKENKEIINEMNYMAIFLCVLPLIFFICFYFFETNDNTIYINHLFLDNNEKFSKSTIIFIFLQLLLLVTIIAYVIHPEIPVYFLEFLQSLFQGKKNNNNINNTNTNDVHLLKYLDKTEWNLKINGIFISLYFVNICLYIYVLLCIIYYNPNDYKKVDNPN